MKSAEQTLRDLAETMAKLPKERAYYCLMSFISETEARVIILGRMVTLLGLYCAAQSAWVTYTFYSLGLWPFGG